MTSVILPMNSELQDELLSKIAKEMQEEIEKELLDLLVRQNLFRAQGWTMVQVKNWREISDDWCSAYLKCNYQCFGHYWYFEDE